MAKFTSSNPLFVDLFYGVVVGSAISTLSAKDVGVLTFQILWLIAVLEDWFLYYSQVVDSDDKAVSWTFKSLLIEFSILTSWLLGFNALAATDPQLRHTFFVCAAVFYGVKIFGGATLYFKHGHLWSRRMLYDCIWLLPVAVGVWYEYSPPTDMNCALTWFSVATASSIVGWWTLTSKWPPGR